MNNLSMYKAVVHLNDMQKKFNHRAKSLKVVHIAINVMHEYSMQYKGAPPKLAKKQGNMKNWRNHKCR